MNWYKLLISQQKIKSVPQDLKNDSSFKAWFGNSKVVDSQGNPLVVYKGMYPFDYTKKEQTEPIDIIQRKEPFPTFDPKDNETVNLAGFFTDDPSVAETFAFSKHKTIYPVYLSIQNPKIFDAKGGMSGNVQFGPSGKPFRDAIKSGKYDGVIILNTQDEGNVYIPLSPNQIKSALSNNTFNKNDPRIHASKIAMPLPSVNNYPAELKNTNLFNKLDNISIEDESNINEHGDLAYLGHGNNGIVYNNSDPNTVVKITKSSREAEIAKSLMDKDIWCVVKVYEVTKLKNAYKIVTEKLLPLNEKEISEIDRTMKFWNDTWKFPRDSEISKRFENLWRCLENNGLDTGDVFPRNIGKRKTGELVLLDLG